MIGRRKWSALLTLLLFLLLRFRTERTQRRFDNADALAKGRTPVVEVAFQADPDSLSVCPAKYRIAMHSDFAYYYDVIWRRGGHQASFLTYWLAPDLDSLDDVSMVFHDFGNLAVPHSRPAHRGRLAIAVGLIRFDFDIPSVVRMRLCAAMQTSVRAVCTRVSLVPLGLNDELLCLCARSACDPRPAHSFGMCTLLVHEAPYLAEFFEYHRLQGFTWLALRVHQSHDSSASLAHHIHAHYPRALDVSLSPDIDSLSLSLPYPVRFRLRTLNEFVHAQKLHFTDCLIRSPVQYVLNNDVDEFLVGNLTQLALLLERVNRPLVLQWIRFATTRNESAALEHQSDEPLGFLVSDGYRMHTQRIYSRLQWPAVVPGGKLCVSTDSREVLSIHRVLTETGARSDTNWTRQTPVESSFAYIAHFRNRPVHLRPKSREAIDMLSASAIKEAPDETVAPEFLPSRFVTAILYEFRHSPLWASFPALHAVKRLP